MNVHASHGQTEEVADDPQVQIQADINRDFPRRWKRFAWAAVHCRCWRHWYGNPLVVIIEFRPLCGRLWWRVR